MILQLYSLPLMTQKYTIIIFLLLSTYVFADDYQVENPNQLRFREMIATRTVTPPIIDGKIDDEVWKHALKESEFFHSKVLDTSAIIDGRISDISKAGFVEGTIVVPQFVIRELQWIADSNDSLKKVRGRRGLEVLKALQEQKDVKVKIFDRDFTNIKEVDLKLVRLAKELTAHLVTNDFNLTKVANLQGVRVLNVNQLANSLRPVILPGEKMKIKVSKSGKDEKQGVGYLDDGTMVVIDNGKKHISEFVDIVITSVIQTPTGRMIFSKVGDLHD